MRSVAIVSACLYCGAAMKDPEETFATLLLASAPGPGSRRQMLAGAGSALAGFAAMQPAFAKTGEFGQVMFFPQSDETLSSPWVSGGDFGRGEGGTFGRPKSDGPILAEGFKKELSREKAALEKQFKTVLSQDANLEKKIWWLVRDNIRGNDVYNMRGNMYALARGSSNVKIAERAAKNVMTELDAFDVALRAKDLDASKKEYADVKSAIASFSALV
mmetsp:Transcript_106684/g.168574  ORF Transcript_106684/g.168574 Transcript_106684/m.168574 type:complete len:217 (-) Transcript_106684:64-714(-)